MCQQIKVFLVIELPGFLNILRSSATEFCICVCLEIQAAWLTSPV